MKKSPKRVLEPAVIDTAKYHDPILKALQQLVDEHKPKFAKLDYTPYFEIYYKKIIHTYNLVETAKCYAYVATDIYNLLCRIKNEVGIVR